MKICCLISGGQTGADRGGLDAAIEAGIPHSGWCPKDRRSEDGVIPDKYILKETASSGYVKRTELNILTSDCTVVFTMGKVGPGSGKTLSFAKSVGKPALLVDISHLGVDESANAVVGWLQGLGKDALTVNVAGNRESHAQGIQGNVARIMSTVIARQS
jgi:hypothetical protein